MTLSVVRNEINNQFKKFISRGVAFAYSAPGYVTLSNAAPLWLNVRCGGTVVGVDFVGDQSAVVVSVFFRSIQNVYVASSSTPLKHGSWCAFFGNPNGFQPAQYGHPASWNNCRMARKFDQPLTEFDVVNETLKFLKYFGPIK